MTNCKICDKQGKHETVRCDICLRWMCWDCSSVNDDQHIYVKKSEDVNGRTWSCQKCIVNKVDVITSLKKIKDQLEEEIEETIKYEEEKDKGQSETCEQNGEKM